MAEYYDISLSEMREFLESQGFQVIVVPRTREIVFSRRIKGSRYPLSLRVYTGITSSGHSRSVGKDAIRVTLWCKVAEDQIMMLGGAKRVHRVKGWKQNLQDRLDRWRDFLVADCPQCGWPLVLRKSKDKHEFYGCIRYPACRFSCSTIDNQYGLYKGRIRKAMDASAQRGVTPR